MLVEHKAEEIRAELDTLLCSMGPDDHNAEAQQLRIELCLLAGASYAFRILAPTKCWPLKLLHLVSKPAHLACELRHATVMELMQTAECCLKTPAPYLHVGISDFSWKLKRMCEDELQTCLRSAGRVPLRLFSIVLLWRSQLTFESKSMEGVHVVLQTMSRAAPRLGHALASDRLQLKLGDPISPSECCELLHPAQQSMADTSSIARFEPMSSDNNLPRLDQPHHCEHTSPALSYRVLGFALPLQRAMPVGAKKAYLFSGPLNPRDCLGKCAFIVAWSYYSSKYMAQCRIVGISGFLAEVKPMLPSVYTTAKAELQRCLSLESEQEQRAPICTTSEATTSSSAESSIVAIETTNATPQKRARTIKSARPTFTVFAYDLIWSASGSGSLSGFLDVASETQLVAKWEKPRPSNDAADNSETAAPDNVQSEDASLEDLCGKCV